MKKRYLTKSNMARAMSKYLSISLQDAKSRISREKPTSEKRTFEIEGEQIEIIFWLTPERFLSGD